MELAIFLAAIIIIALASYASFLFYKLYQQKQAIETAKQEKQLAAETKKQQVLTDIRYIAQAMLEERCELSEGVMRIAKLFEMLSLTDQVKSNYPALFAHYQVIAQHPIKEARKRLQKQQRMKLDLERMKSENQYESEILEEAKLISQYQDIRH